VLSKKGFKELNRPFPQVIHTQKGTFCGNKYKKFSFKVKPKDLKILEKCGAKRAKGIYQKKLDFLCILILYLTSLFKTLSKTKTIERRFLNETDVSTQQ